MTRRPAMTRYLSAVALSLAASLLTPEAKAQKVVVYREGQMVEPQDVAAVLNRSIRLLDEEPASKTFTAVPASSLTKTSAAAAGAASKARHDPNADASSLSLPVRFAFDSAEIQPAARTQLDALAKGIKLLAPNRNITVEGHTDAVGTEAYNLELSRQRAQAVRDYLVAHHGIDPARLKTVGYGKERPIESDPYAAVNRRVQFHGS